MNTARIALRNLQRQKRRTFLLAGAIAFGVFIVTLVNAFSAGAVRILKENFADMIGGHVFVSLQHRVGDKTVSIIEDEAPLIGALHRLGVRDEQITRTVDMQQAQLIYGSKSEVQGIIGVDWKEERGLAAKLGLPTNVYDRLAGGEEGIILSRKIAGKLKVGVGDPLLARGETVTGQANVGDVRVVYVTADNSDTSSLFSFASTSFVNRLLNLPDKKAYSTLRVRLATLDMADAFALKLEAELKASYRLAPKNLGQPGMESNVFKMGEGSGDFEGIRAQVSTINQFLSQISQLSTGLQIASFFMLSILLVITMIGIANTFRMIMYERVREIGTMRAVGMLRRHVRRLFLYEALFLALAGVGMGVAFGYLVTLALSLVNFGTEGFFSLFLQNGHLSFLVRLLDVSVIVVLVSVFTLLAAQGPARKAARLHPVDALRTSY